MGLPQRSYDAIVIGSGPNGLAAAITLAQAHRSVLVVEGEDSIGGGTRSAELTLPGFLHDVCSAVHPLAFGSPFFRTLPLHEHGLQWIEPPAQLAHPFDDGTAVLVERSVALTADNFGADACEYSAFMTPLVAAWPKLETSLLGPLGFPAHPIAMLRFVLLAMSSASALARKSFHNSKARALFAGIAAHSVLPLERVPSAAFGLVLGIAAHTFGWPFPRGGSRKIAEALASHLRSLGGEIVTGTKIESLDGLPTSRAILCDVTPRQLLRIAGSRFPAGFSRKLERYRYGPGACKVDSGRSTAPSHGRRPHVAGPARFISRAALKKSRRPSARRGEEKTARNPSCFSRSPPFLIPHALPPASTWLGRIATCRTHLNSIWPSESKIKGNASAPSFRKLILKRNVITAANLELHNPNLVGGDFNGGSPELDQLLFRPTWQRYRTAARGLYLCSSSTPPGAGVHGMCGYGAARAALRDNF